MHTNTRRRRNVMVVSTAATVALAVGGGTAYAMSSHAAPGVAAPSPSGQVASSTSGTLSPVNTSGFPTGGKNPGIFVDRCGYSHEAANDPILAPGNTGASMHHDFFGNTATNASSTSASLLGGTTTCKTSADASAYWSPVMSQNGKALTPGVGVIYWRQRGPAAARAVQTMPAGLQMIAGNESATSPQPTSVVGWSCAAKDGTARKTTSTPHNCAPGTDLRVTVQFPSCWDGTHLSAVGQSNVVYPDGQGTCPASHPKVIPQVVFHTTYPTSSAAGLTLSMTPAVQGSTNTEHVDFINGWTQHTFDSDVAACISTQTRCGKVVGAAATPQGPTKKHLANSAKRAKKHHHRHQRGTATSPTA